MNDEQTGSPEPAEAAQEQPPAVIDARSAQRLILLLLALWTALSGLALTFFQDASAATIGGGLEGGQGAAAQRLLGVHLLVLSPIYGLLAWRPERFRLFAWVPYAAQGGVVAATLFDITTGDRDLDDGALPLIVATIFLVLLVYVWRASRRVEPAPAAREAAAATAEESPPPVASEPGTEPDA